MVGSYPFGLLIGAALVLASIAAAPAAVDVAPKVSDGEIVERLTRVETNLSAVQTRLGSLEDRVQQLRADIDGRFVRSTRASHGSTTDSTSSRRAWIGSSIACTA